MNKEQLKEEIGLQLMKYSMTVAEIDEATERALTAFDTFLEGIAGEVEAERQVEPKDLWCQGRNHGLNRAAYITRSHKSSNDKQV